MSLKDEAAERLIAWHFRVEPEMQEIYRFFSEDEEEPREPIKLLEVSEATFETGRVDVFGFGAAGDIPYPTALGLVTPAEMERIHRREIPLPSGWNLDTARRYVPTELSHAA